MAHVILFHSPSCPHCRYVLSEVLPPLQEQYGDKLEIQLYNLQEEEGAGAFQALLQAWPDAPGSIPQAYISDHVLIGSDQIPNELPGIIDTCLADGGCDWPFTFVSASDGTDTAAVNPGSEQAAVDAVQTYDSEVVLIGAFAFTVVIMGLVYFRFMR